MTAQFTLSAFGDEIADDVDEQLRVLNELDIRYLELRRAWGTNVLELSDGEVRRLSRPLRSPLNPRELHRQPRRQSPR